MVLEEPIRPLAERKSEEATLSPFDADGCECPSRRLGGRLCAMRSCCTPCGTPALLSKLGTRIGGEPARAQVAPLRYCLRVGERVAATGKFLLALSQTE